MDDHERETLLDRVERDSATIGADIPETIELDGDQVALQEFVFEVRDGGTDEDLTPVKRLLRRERNHRVDLIETGQIDRARGEELVDEIAGIDRALNALEGDDTDSIADEMQRREAQDERRWLDFLGEVRGDGGR